MHRQDQLVPPLQGPGDRAGDGREVSSRPQVGARPAGPAGAVRRRRDEMAVRRAESVHRRVQERGHVVTSYGTVGWCSQGDADVTWSVTNGPFIFKCTGTVE